MALCSGSVLKLIMLGPGETDRKEWEAVGAVDRDEGDCCCCCSWPDRGSGGDNRQS